METRRALQELESFRRHDDEGRKRTSAGSLAISTVTVKHHHRFCCGFVANRAASASAREGCGYCNHKTGSVSTDGLVRRARSTTRTAGSGDSPPASPPTPLDARAQ